MAKDKEKVRFETKFLLVYFLCVPVFLVLYLLSIGPVIAMQVVDGDEPNAFVTALYAPLHWLPKNRKFEKIIDNYINDCIDELREK